MVSVLRDENKGLSGRVMEAERRTVIDLQGQLLENKGSQLKSLTATVETVVTESVQKSYSQATANHVSTPALALITPAAFQRVLRT